jgi:hypothetical protein
MAQPFRNKLGDLVVIVSPRELASVNVSVSGGLWFNRDFTRAIPVSSLLQLVDHHSYIAVRLKSRQGLYHVASEHAPIRGNKVESPRTTPRQLGVLAHGWPIPELCSNDDVIVAVDHCMVTACELRVRG